MKKIQPLSNHIIVEYFKEEETKSGVILSNVSNKKPPHGKVVAVGPGRLDRHGNFIEVTVKPGDIVYFDPFTPRELQIDNRKYLVLREDDLFVKA